MVGPAGSASSFGTPSQGFYGYVSSDRQGHFHRTSTFVGQEYEQEEELPRQQSESAIRALLYYPATALGRRKSTLGFFASTPLYV